MRNFKKFLALVLAMLMVVSAAATVSAFSDVAEDNQYAAAIADLVEKGIVNGVGDDKFNPDGSVERYQMALMMARALDPDKTNEEWAEGMSIFTDVTEWYGAINYAYMNGIVTGIGNLQFAPHAGIRYQDALIMALRALGYTVDVSGDPYWLAAYNQAAKIGLTKNVAVNKGDKVLTRAETAQVIFNMLYTTPADGGLTIAAKNFGEATVKNTTTVVITGTGSQAYTGKSEALVDDTYVTVQVLNEDGTLGDGFFTKFDKLGFGEDVKPDDVIGYSVGLVNLNGTDFDKAIPGKATVLTNNSENVKVDGNKITIDGKVYYLVDEYSKSTIKNELIVKDDSGVIATNTLNSASDLYFNKAGDVVDKDGNVLAVKSEVTSRNGQTLYALKSDVDKDAFLLYTADELVKVKAIADKYNKTDSVTGYSDVASLSGAFQITLFDDNGDNKYDRAIITPIYMSVYSANNNEGKFTVEGPAKGEKVQVVGKDLTKGDIFVYTYNKQTKVVNVLATLDLQYGTIERINVTANDSKDWTIKISGETYKFGLPNDGAAIGATLKEANPDDLTDISKIVSKPALKYVRANDFVNSTSVASTVKFYAYNGYIVYAESYDVEEAFSLVAIKSVNDYSSKAVIADIYVDGKLVNDAEISEVLYNGKTVKLADLSSWALVNVIRTFDGIEGNIYKGIKLEDGSYRIGIDLVKNGVVSGKIKETVKDGGFGYYEYTIATNASKVEFFDGIAFNEGDSNRKDNTIRTDDNTVFYFVKGNDLKVAVTSGKDSVIKLDGTKTKIYADKLGYSKDDKKGVASKVIVVDYKSLEGFGLVSTVNSIVYIPEKVATGKFEAKTAEEFGLNGYTGTYYYYSNVAVNMSNGDKVSLYSSYRLTAGCAYQVDENGVVVPFEFEENNKEVTVNGINLTNAEDPTNKYVARYFGVKSVNKSDIVLDDRYFYIGNGENGIVNYNDKVNTFKAQLIDDKDGVNVKVGGDAKNLIADGKTAMFYYLASNGQASDLKDGIFVAIVKTETTPVDPTEAGVANATYTFNGSTYGAIYDESKTNGTGKVTLYNDSVKLGEKVYEQASGSAAADATYSATIKVLKNGAFTNDTEASVKASYDKGVLTVEGFTVKNVPTLAVDLAAGTYEITVSFPLSGTTCAVTYYAIVK